MADLPLKARTNRVEVTGLTKNDTWQTVDLASYLQHDDPKIVILEFTYTPFGVNGEYSARPVGDSFVRTGVVTAGSNTPERDTVAISLGLGTSIEYRMGSSTHMYVVGEFGGDGVNALTTMPELPRSGGTYADYDMTTLLGAIAPNDRGDVEAVICVLSTLSGGDAGIRRNGGTGGNFGGQTPSEQLAWGVAKVDDEDIFEQFATSTGKNNAANGWVNLVGYIRRGYGFEANPDPSNNISPAAGAAANVNVGLHADKTETEAIIRSQLNFTNTFFGMNIRAKDSTNPNYLKTAISRVTQPVNLIDEEVVLFRSVTNFTFWVEATQYTPPGASGIIEQSFGSYTTALVGTAGPFQVLKSLLATYVSTIALQAAYEATLSLEANIDSETISLEAEYTPGLSLQANTDEVSLEGTYSVSMALGANQDSEEIELEATYIETLSLLATYEPAVSLLANTDDNPAISLAATVENSISLTSEYAPEITLEANLDGC